jgi:hypothetical protein
MMLCPLIAISPTASGPGGTSFGTPIKPRPVVSLWPTLIPASLVQQTVSMWEV